MVNLGNDMMVHDGLMLLDPFLLVFELFLLLSMMFMPLFGQFWGELKVYR